MAVIGRRHDDRVESAAGEQVVGGVEGARVGCNRRKGRARRRMRIGEGDDIDFTRGQGGAAERAPAISHTDDPVPYPGQTLFLGLKVRSMAATAADTRLVVASTRTAQWRGFAGRLGKHPVLRAIAKAGLTI